jgi:hypothetical protein
MDEGHVLYVTSPGRKPMRIRSRRTRSADGWASLPLPTKITTFPLRKWPLVSFLARTMFDFAKYGCRHFVPIDPGNPGGSMCVHGEEAYSLEQAGLVGAVERPANGAPKGRVLP